MDLLKFYLFFRPLLGSLACEQGFRRRLLLQFQKTSQKFRWREEGGRWKIQIQPKIRFPPPWCVS